MSVRGNGCQKMSTIFFKYIMNEYHKVSKHALRSVRGNVCQKLSVRQTENR